MQRQLVTYASAQQIINLPSELGSDPASSTSERSIVVDDLANLNRVLSQATAARIAAEARRNQIGRAGASAEALSNNAINNLREQRADLAAEYQKMMVQFEPGYPTARALQSQIDDLDRSISREEARVTSAIHSTYREAVERERALEPASRTAVFWTFAGAASNTISSSRKWTPIARFMTAYCNDLKEIGVAGGVGVNNIAIVDAARSPRNRPARV